MPFLHPLAVVLAEDLTFPSCIVRPEGPRRLDLGQRFA